MGSINRRAFNLGLLASLSALASGSLGPGEVRAAGAKPGGWCLPLTKGAEESIYDFSLDLLDGKGAIFTLSTLRGRGVWLNFFASWCGPCRREASNIVMMADRYRDEGLRVVGIDIGEDPPHAREFRDSFGVSYPIALDRKSQVFDTFGYREIPTHMFFDATGALTCVSSGDLTPNQMENEIAVALVGRMIGGKRIAATRSDGTPYVEPTNSPKPTAAPDPSATDT